MYAAGDPVLLMWFHRTPPTARRASARRNQSRLGKRAEAQTAVARSPWSYCSVHRQL
ncbi:unnamed protein product, partial [Lepidochelys olivacea]